MEHIITITKQGDKYISLIKCPVCGSITTLKLTIEQGKAVKRWLKHGGIFTQYLPVIDNETKIMYELFTTGICSKCSLSSHYGGEK